jgi:phosphoglycerate dehydrogenase-like enzyme
VSFGSGIADADNRVRAVAPLAVYTDWDELDVTHGERALRDAGWDVRRLGTTNPAAIAAAAADATAVCVGYALLDRPLLDRLPASRVVATMSAGVDMVDLDAATDRGIWVANVPAAATEEVAVHALAMALALVRHLPFMDRDVRGGHWRLRLDEPPRRPATLTLGLLGLGHIGLRTAELARGVFGAVAAHDPGVPQDAWPPDVERLELGALAARADVLSLHLPHEPGAPPLVDAALLGSLPRGAFLVNVSRGALVDRAALLAALDSGRLAGAALDVLDREPPPSRDAVVHHPRVLVTPHAAFLSAETADAYPREQAANVLAWQRTGRPLTPVREL